MVQNSVSFSSLNSHGIFNVVSTRLWKSVNPFVGYEAVQRISAGLGLQKIEQVLHRIIFAEQVHDSRVHICQPEDGGSIRLSVDALISNNPNHILAIYSSDCIPLLLYDPENKVVGAIHAGYKGLSRGIISNVLKAFETNFNSDTSKIIVGIAPFIRVCCYEVRDDIFTLIEASNWQSYLKSNFGKFFLDLGSIVKNQLIEFGVSPSRIEDLEICTSCRSDLFFSVRNRQPEEERGSCFVSLISLSQLN
ncbi:hypothetical protein BV378_12390 [Nostoc sp. RF31YmG]|jgi:YfiH family protein|nr:hypothetical protein BV378_12390 [Nostoc sp. RF31YmG]